MTKTTDPEWMRAELLHSERWEDEGGTTTGIEVTRDYMTGRFVRPMLIMAGLQDIPRHWNSKIIIGPAQTRMVFGSLKKDATSKE